MTDQELLAKKLAFIETCVRELRDVAAPERIETDIREERFIAHTLQKLPFRQRSTLPRTLCPINVSASRRRTATCLRSL